MKKLMASAAMLTAVVMAVSCGKDDDKPSNSITLSKIQAKWSLTSIDIQYGPADSLINGTAADYFDFRTDGNVYTSFDGEQDTSSYSVLNDNKMMIGIDTVDIKQLTSSQFVFEKDTLIAPIVVKTIVSLHK